MQKRIWFNRTFSTAYHYVEMIRNNPDGQAFTIITTHPKPTSLMLQVSDYSELEPKLPIGEYPHYCLEFCKKHQIDIFVPHFGLDEIAKHELEFQKSGIRVMLSGSKELLKLVSDKGDLFKSLRGIEGITLPDYYIVRNADEFRDAYRNLKQMGHKQICFKPVRGEGGAGFRIINELPNNIESIYNSVNSTIYLDELIRLLASVEQFVPLMIMEFMGGYEYSVDCLGATDGLLAAVPRKKAEGRIRELEYNELLISQAHRIHKLIPLQYNFNIQFIYQGDIPKLLEINPRMSGGLYTSCLSGINFPYLAIKMLLNQDIAVPEPAFGIHATHIEQEIILKNFF
jgi:carbamoylphosphate synthase large subunit